MEKTLEVKKNSGVLWGAIIGNALEWYDFIIYTYFAKDIAKVILPVKGSLQEAIWMTAFFAIGFIARPLGSLFFGYIGDKLSRKTALLWSIYFMAIPTTLIGLLPNYNTVGWLAPLLLALIRIFQGLAIGGEFSGSMVFMYEHAPKNQKGLLTSFSTFSCLIGVVMGSGIAFAFSHAMSAEKLSSWGWRIPFLFSFIGSWIGSFMRKNLKDPEEYILQKEKKSSFSLKSFKENLSGLVNIFLLDCLTACGFFMIVTFLPMYLSGYNMLNWSRNYALAINTFNMVVLAFSTLLGGYLVDKFGKKNVLAACAYSTILLSSPAFYLLAIYPLIGQLLLVIPFGIFFGAIPFALCQELPTAIRFTGLSFAHNLSMTVFGSGAPFLALKLIEYTNFLISPSFLLIGASVITTFGVYLSRREDF